MGLQPTDLIRGHPRLVRTDNDRKKVDPRERNIIGSSRELPDCAAFADKEWKLAGVD